MNDPSALDADEPADFLRRRVQQLLYVLLAAVVCSALYKAMSPGSAAPVELLASVAAFAAALLLLRFGRVEDAATIMLATVTLMLIVQAVRHEGLRDESIVGMPCVLVVAALMGKRWQMVTALAAMLGTVVLLGVVNTQGWYVNRIPSFGASTVIDLSLILLVTAFCVALLARDLSRTRARLHAENAAVRRSRSELEFLATHDALTGVPNRGMLAARFEHAMAAASRSRPRLALLCLDIDHFKNVNDSLGHPAGDLLLISLGTRLQRMLRAVGTVARQGGDDFIVLLDGVANTDAVAEVATKALAVAAERQVLAGVEVRVGASIGIAIYPDDGGDFDSLMKKADIAMYRAKQGGRHAFLFYDEAVNDAVVEQMQMSDGMRQALERGEFELHYQPQIDLAHGRVTGAEALLRWRHPVHGLVAPGRFIPVAEQTGQIVEIGAWVLTEACRQAQAWRQAGLHGLVVSVNLSPVQARRGAIEREVNAALDASGLPPALLELELTESLLLEDCAALRATLGRLRARGVSFSIDDFGTGYSNLSYLKAFEVGRLKIDQSFVRELHDNAQDEAIVRAIVQMASALHLGVIAEGIEDEATLRRVRDLGCDRGQGFLWSPPLPAAAFESFVLARGGRGNLNTTMSGSAPLCADARSGSARSDEFEEKTSAEPLGGAQGQGGAGGYASRQDAGRTGQAARRALQPDHRSGRAHSVPSFGHALATAQTVKVECLPSSTGMVIGAVRQDEGALQERLAARLTARGNAATLAYPCNYAINYRTLHSLGD